MTTPQIILWVVVLVACIIYIFIETRKAKPKKRKPMATMNKHPAMQAPINRKPSNKT